MAAMMAADRPVSTAAGAPTPIDPRLSSSTNHTARNTANTMALPRLMDGPGQAPSRSSTMPMHGPTTPSCYAALRARAGNEAGVGRPSEGVETAQMNWNGLPVSFSNASL